MKKNEDKILENYEEETDEILKRMLHILARADRKINDSAYRKALDNLQGK